MFHDIMDYEVKLGNECYPAGHKFIYAREDALESQKSLSVSTCDSFRHPLAS
jgi:hypothetical protein